MSHNHRKTLQALFAHPVSSNLDPKHVFAALEDIGAEVTHGGHGQVVVKLNGHTHGFHDTRHSLSKEEVGAIRKFLTVAGVDPAQYPA
jgi:MOSC domain-containing protein YiiM